MKGPTPNVPSVALSVPREPTTYARANALVRRHRDIRRRRNTLLLVLIVAIGTISVTGAVTSGRPILSFGTFAYFTVVLALAVLATWIGDWIEWHWRGWRSQKEWAAGGDALRYVISPESVRMSFDGGESELSWMKFQRAVLSDRFLLLFVQPQVAWFLPLDGLGEEQVDAILHWAAQRTPGGVASAGR